MILLRAIFALAGMQMMLNTCQLATHHSKGLSKSVYIQTFAFPQSFQPTQYAQVFFFRTALQNSNWMNTHFCLMKHLKFLSYCFI